MDAIALTVARSTGITADAMCPFDHDERDHTLTREGDTFYCQHDDSHTFDRFTLRQIHGKDTP